MDDLAAANKMEKLAETLVLMDEATDSVFNPLLDEFTELAIWARQADQEQAIEACARATQIIIATQENQLTPESCQETLSGIIGQLQHVFCHGFEGNQGWAPEVLPESNPTPLSSLADEHILGEFLARQELMIDELEGILLALEKNPQGEALHRCHRLVHTLKGESSLLGMNHVENVCHSMEEALAANRIDALFEAKDWLSATFQAYAGRDVKVVRASELIGRLTASPILPFVQASTAESLSEHVKQALIDAIEDEPIQTANVSIPESVQQLELDPQTDPTLLGDFLSESNEHLETVDLGLMTLESDPTQKDTLNGIFRAFHTIKGLAGFLNLIPVRMLAHESENLLDKLRSGEMEWSPAITEVLFASVDGLRKLIGFLDPSSGTGATVPLRKLIEGIQSITVGKDFFDVKPAVKASKKNPVQPQTIMPTETVSEQLQNPVTVNVPVEASSGNVHMTQENLESTSDAPHFKNEEAKPGTNTQLAVQVRETVKIESDRLDRLLDTIGELVIAEAMIVQSPELRGKVSASMAQRLSHLDKITRHLQELGTSLRMVPIRPVFQKMARLVRDLSMKCGKQVEFVTVGDHTEMDKAVVDRIADPLVHMVRNAVDHGIEANPSDRQILGKPLSAKLKLSAYQKGGNICIELEDDGRGLNREAILKKAKQRGLFNGDDSVLEDREVWNFIFEPGFSTAAAVTEVSGRGVGMDVVKRTFEELRGRIEIQSIKDQGTRFTIWLPLTMAIIDGMVVRIGQERCIFPTLSVTTVLPFVEDETVSVLNKGRLLNFQGKQIPVYPLESFFGDGESQRNQKRLCVLAETEGRTIGFLIDDLIGKQQIVIKSLGDAFKDILGLAGGAILTDGGVGLILDIDGLVKALTSGTPSAFTQSLSLHNQSGVAA